MNQLTKVFDGHDLTIMEKEGEPIFKLSDVCKILGLGNPSQVRSRLEDGVISNEVIRDSLGRAQQAIFVNEDGLYDVILDSRKPEAKRFRKWITSEVLPSIRKTGGYQPKVLTPKEQLVASMKLSLETSEELEGVKSKVSELEERFDNELTLNHGQATALHHAIKKRVESLFDNGIMGTLETKRQMYSHIHSQLRRAFQAPTYREIRRVDYDDAIRWVEAWRPL